MRITTSLGCLAFLFCFHGHANAVSKCTHQGELGSWSIWANPDGYIISPKGSFDVFRVFTPIYYEDKPPAFDASFQFGPSKTKDDGPSGIPSLQVRIDIENWRWDGDNVDLGATIDEFAEVLGFTGYIISNDSISQVFKILNGGKDVTISARYIGTSKGDVQLGKWAITSPEYVATDQYGKYLSSFLGRRRTLGLCE